MRSLHTANLVFSVVIFEDTETAGHFSSNRKESVQRHRRDSGAQGGGGVGLLQDKVTKDSGEKPSQDDPTCQSPTDKKARITLWAWDSFPPAMFLWGLLTRTPGRPGMALLPSSHSGSRVPVLSLPPPNAGSLLLCEQHRKDLASEK